MNFEPMDYTLGAHFLSALVNGDETGLSDEESQQLTDFLTGTHEQRGEGHWATTDDADEFGRCEITGLRGNVERVQWMRCVP